MYPKNNHKNPVVSSQSLLAALLKKTIEVSNFRDLRAVARTFAAKRVSRLRVDRYLGTHPRSLLNIGCGNNHIPGWLNVDLDCGVRAGVVYLDATRPFPIKTGAFDAVLYEHMIEHIPKPDAVRMIGEIFRVLKPGGKFRVVTPDLDTLIDLFRRPIEGPAQRYMDCIARIHGVTSVSPGDAVNLAFYEYGHRHIYMVSELRSMLVDAGFTDILEGRGGYASDSVFDGVEGHPKIVGVDLDAFEAFAFEATKREG